MLVSEPTPTYNRRPSGLASRLRVQCPPGLNRASGAAGRFDARRARRVGERHHAIRVADVERSVDQRHAERLAQALQQRVARLCDAVAVRVAQQRDAIRALADGGRALQGRHHRVVEHVFRGPERLHCLGHGDVPIGQHVDPARMLQSGSERVHRQPRRWGSACAPTPSRARWAFSGWARRLAAGRAGCVEPRLPLEAASVPASSVATPGPLRPPAPRRERRGSFVHSSFPPATPQCGRSVAHSPRTAAPAPAR
jgi:hypothetical protein